ncbi:hypothetical protein RBH29_03735 [Herbivorax sp. ANBcel31]|nr:hypothetical protein [Herbivorax sp. ANBcel31]MDQ2085543.1 hypothetical protein [Herbivorax sp. ANBcel31]
MSGQYYITFIGCGDRIDVEAKNWWLTVNQEKKFLIGGFSI